MWSAISRWFGPGSSEIKLGDVLDGRYRVLIGPFPGTFASVYVCADVVKGSEVAIKVFKRDSVVRDMGAREANALQILNEADPDHRSIIEYYGCFSMHGRCCLVLERSGISLWDAFQIRQAPFGVESCRRIGYQIACALRICHEHGLIHTDLKLENVLLPAGFDVHHGFETGNYSVKLIDFGSSENSRKWNWGIVSTRYYRAPEVILGLEWGFECDIWCLGCLLLEIVFGQIGLSSRNPGKHICRIHTMIGGIPKWMFDQCTDFQLLDTIKTNKWSENEDLTDIRELLAFDSTLQDLIMRMLDPDPQKRISLNQAIMHPFFDSIRVEAA